MTKTKESGLVRRAVEGDSDAFAQLYRENIGRLRMVLRGLTHNREDAEDLTADVFVLALRKIQHFRGEARFSTWLHRIAVRVFLMRERRSKTPAGRAIADAVSLDEPTETGLILRDSISYVDRRQRAVDLEVARHLLKLRPQTQKILILHAVYGLNNPELARVLGVHPLCSKSRLCRAKAEARRLWRAPCATM